MHTIKTATLKPAKQSRPRDPETGARLLVNGESKPLNKYWRARISDGSVVVMSDDKSSVDDKPSKPTRSKKTDSQDTHNEDQS